MARRPIFPVEADAPLVIHSNAVLSGAIAFQLLEAIARRDTQLVERRHRVQLHERPQHHPVEPGVKTPHGVSLKQALSLATWLVDAGVRRFARTDSVGTWISWHTRDVQAPPPKRVSDLRTVEWQ